MSDASEWTTVTLAEVADIRFSNVDKKSLAGEKSVRLCNYMDVYSNNYITADLPFMEATATAPEMDRFRVEKGDNMITKDSETPDDIGIPAVVIDDIPNLICGYHLALIRPKRDKIDPAYLSKQLGSNQSAKYFSRLANGSTRYGLSSSAIASIKIPLAPLVEQCRLADVLSTLDKAIEKTETLIAKYQQIKSGLMHDLFTRGVTSDGKLRLPREQAPELYQETPIGWFPKEWEVRPFRSVLAGNLQNGYFKKPELVGTGYKLVNVSELYQPFGIDTDHPKVERVAATSADFHKFGVQEGDLFFTRTRSSLVLSGIAQCNTVLKLMEPTLFECHVIRGKPDKNIVNSTFLGLYFQTPVARRELMSRAKQTTMTTISQPDIVSVPVLRPPLDEQTSIAQRITSNMMSIHAEEAHLTKFRQQKHGLMHDLLTGKVRVGQNVISQEMTGG